MRKELIIISSFRIKTIQFQLILNSQWLITAAHCVAWGREVTRSRIQVGGHNLHGRMVTRRVAKIKIHLHYNSRTNDNDIALIKLNRRVKLSGRVRTEEHITRVCFPP